MKRNEKKKMGMKYCEAHNRNKELFCFKCKGKEEPMCPLCMCTHQNEIHGERTVHITTIIGEVLTQVSELMKDGVQHQEVITQHNAKAEKLIKDKEDIRIQLDERLESLMVFYTQQKAIVAENNAAMLKSHERILKESQKAEYKINDNLNNPDKVANRVKEMIDREDYWQALAEANRALVEDVVFDDTQIKDELGKSEVCLQAYQHQLATLDIMPLHSTQYNTLLSDKEHLRALLLQEQTDHKQSQAAHVQAISNAQSLIVLETKDHEFATLQSITYLCHIHRG